MPGQLAQVRPFPSEARLGTIRRSRFSEGLGTPKRGGPNGGPERAFGGTVSDESPGLRMLRRKTESIIAILLAGTIQGPCSDGIVENMLLSHARISCSDGEFTYRDVRICTCRGIRRVPDSEFSASCIPRWLPTSMRGRS